jgi:hypothetical protein
MVQMLVYLDLKYHSKDFPEASHNRTPSSAIRAEIAPSFNQSH